MLYIRDKVLCLAHSPFELIATKLIGFMTIVYILLISFRMSLDSDMDGDRWARERSDNSNSSSEGAYTLMNMDEEKNIVGGFSLCPPPKS